MELRFDAAQPHQVSAVEAIADLFEGQPRIESETRFAPGVGFGAAPNRLDVIDDSLLANLRKVQERNGVTPDSELKFIEGGIQTPRGPIEIRFPNFSVEMETGTGKTYVYIRTALELFRRYGFRKFVIIVPSIAIREGVLKTLEITRNHFANLYDKVPYRYYDYDSENLTQVREFALADSIDFMIMTLDSFNKSKNVIYQATDRLQGEKPIHFIQAARPILILDEPQNMESEISVKSLAALYPLFAIRYSATHKNPYNLVHRLTPFDAYRQGLVKRIEVAGITSEHDENRPYLRLVEIRAEKKTLTARLAVRVLQKSQIVKERTIKVRPDENLEEKTNRTEYKDYTLSVISANGGFVKFTNGIELQLGNATGDDKRALFEAQIRYTFETHVDKQERLRPLGIKVLSLFFLDRVDSYANGGIARQLFDKCFRELQPEVPEWKGRSPGEVQSAYFAEKVQKGAPAEYIESQTGKTKEDQAAFRLIMRDKERLLSLDEPVGFIFSHSALREGWDNPNVFQICTLNQSISEIKKRQEIGRGMRLAVNQKGERVSDPKVNRLTVVANESYTKYVERLQAEIEDDFGKEGTPPTPPNARERSKARLRKEYILRPEFQRLWEKIAQKTWYSVTIDTEALLSEVVPDVDKVTIPRPRLSIRMGEVRIQDRDVLEAVYGGGGSIDSPQLMASTNVLDLVISLLERSTPPIRLTRKTIFEIVRRTKNQDAVRYNPFELASTVVQILKQKLADHLIQGIQYHPKGIWYELSDLEDEIEGYSEYFVFGAHSIYDRVEFDSTVEKQFVIDLESRKDVKMYTKLPRWFFVDTPIGRYNPDWAIVLEQLDAHGRGKEHLYLVRETKGAADLGKLQWPNEKRKLICGERHFKDALGVDYKFGKTASELLP